MRLTENDEMLHAYSRRIDPISRSAKPFCQGEAGVVPQQNVSVIRPETLMR